MKHATRFSVQTDKDRDTKSCILQVSPYSLYLVTGPLEMII